MVCAGIVVFLSVLLTLPRAKPPRSDSGVDVNTPDVEWAAIDAFNRGEYGKAVPLLQEASYALRDSPARRGALLRMLRQAQSALPTTTGGGPATRPSTTQRTPHAPPAPGQIREMTIRDLGNFNYDTTGGVIPEDVRRLSGSRVRLSGYMMPLTEATKVRQFDLMPSLSSCCFNQPPGVEHVVRVTCDRGAAIEYSPDVVVVEGTLTVGEQREDGIVVSLYQVQATKVTPQGK
jgi:hypothetical protein